MGEDVTTVGFALDGRSYEIDLNADNARKLRDCLVRFVAAGRRLRPSRGGAAVRASSARDLAGRERTRAIRRWARQAGYDVLGRGRVSARVTEAYERAQQEPAERSSKMAPQKIVEKADPGSRRPSYSG